MFRKAVDDELEMREIFNQLSRRLGRDPTEVEIAAEYQARVLHPLYGSKGYVTR